MGILTDCWQLAARYLGTRVNRLRLTGCRIQVILSVKIKSETNFKLLVVKSGFSNTWGLPQEGVNIGEDFVDAVKRCLSVECGVEINGKNNTQFERAFNIRKISYVSTLELPKDRHDERNISDEAAGTFYESITLTKKAYWVADIYISSINDIEIKPDNNEVIDYRWMELDDAIKLISKNNRKEKADLFINCFNGKL